MDGKIKNKEREACYNEIYINLILQPMYNYNKLRPINSD